MRTGIKDIAAWAMLGVAAALMLSPVTHASYNTPKAGFQTIKGTALNFGSTGDQGTLPVPVNLTKYAVTAVAVTNCSATPVLASIAVWSGASASGINIVAAGTITGATSASVIINSTVTAAGLTTALTGSNIYVNVGVANASALTCDVYVTLKDLT